MNDITFSYAEELHGKGYIIATYFLRSSHEDDIIAKVKALAVGQSIGTWTPVRGVTRQMQEHHLARVVAVYDVPPVELKSDLPPDGRAFIIQIAFPEINFGSQFPMLFTTLLGNDVSTATQMKLIDLHLSPSFVSGFKGPKFGILGLRDYLVVKDRPILLNMIKPCTGFSPKVGARIFEETARGGVDIIKDDELLGNPSFNQLVDRANMYREAADRVFQETGHRAIYCANITDRPERIIENAHRAEELGAGMLMINQNATGLGMLQAVAEDPHVTIPVINHYAGAGTLTENPYSGISSPLLLGKLSRLAGADAAHYSSIYSSYPLLREKYLRIADMLRMPLYDLKPSLPIVGGGARPDTVAPTVADLGCDVMLAVGGAIHGHPGGATAGARAMRQAIDAVSSGIDIAEYAKDHLELAKALKVWGKSP